MADPSLIGLPFYAGGPDMAYTGVMPTLQGAQTHAEPSVPGNHEIVQGPIPLICYVCTNNSKFSDISHLLTHVSSKGHLSRLYHTEIMALNSPHSRRIVEKFNTWKDTYKIDQLVLQRMEARDERGIQSQSQSQSRSQTPASVQSATRRGSKQQRGGARGGTRNSGGRGGGGGSNGSGSGGRGGHGGRGRGRGSTGSRGSARQTQELTDIKYESDESDDEDVGDGYDMAKGTPLHPWHGVLNPLVPTGSGLNATPQATFDDLGYENASSDDNSSFPSEVLTDGEYKNVDTSIPTLKGSIYPGMGLFDSAREDQRRKRNQRKPPGVHQQLQVNSTLVTTDEEVYDLNLTYQRTRDVYDEPSIDGSEDEKQEQEQETPKKRKRRSQARPATSSKKNGRYSAPSRDGAPTLRTARTSTQAANSGARTRGQTQSRRGRATRSVVSRSPMPQLLHNHGFQEEAGMFQEPMSGHNELGWTLPYQPYPVEPLESLESSPPFEQSLESSQPFEQSLKFSQPFEQSLEFSQPFEQSLEFSQPFESSQPLEQFLESSQTSQLSQSFQSEPSFNLEQSFINPELSFNSEQSFSLEQPFNPEQSSSPEQPFYSVQPFYPVQSYQHMQPYRPVQSYQPLQDSQPEQHFILHASYIPADTAEQTVPTTPLDGEDSSESGPLMNELLYQGLTWVYSQDRLPGLAALRPGNPNLSFASSSPGYKRTPTPSQFAGKENDGLTHNSLALKSTVASSNPYLQSTDSTQGENYNPLYVQNRARDGLGFRPYSSYSEDVKPSTAGFQPINGRAAGDFDSLQMSSQHNEEAELWDIPDEQGAQASSNHSASYHPTQADDNAFDF
ncbi:hypothetical protein Hte_000460 [Hypoxylon texense]